MGGGKKPQAAAAPQVAAPAVSPDRIAQRALAALRRIGQSLDSMPIPALRRLLEMLVDRVVIDLETRDVELALRLPSWALDDVETMCLKSNPLHSIRPEAHHDCSILLVSVRLQWWRSDRQYVAFDFAVLDFLQQQSVCGAPPVVFETVADHLHAFRVHHRNA